MPQHHLSLSWHSTCFVFFLSSSFNFLSCVLQTRTPRVTRLSPTQPALADQASRVSFASAENLETMSEPDIPIGFNRMNRLRQSLPLARTSSQAKLRAPGQTSVFKKTSTLCVLHCGLNDLRVLLLHQLQ